MFNSQYCIHTHVAIATRCIVIYLNSFFSYLIGYLLIVEFQIAPSNSTTARGGPVTFYCQVATSSSISLSWRHNGITVIPNNRTQQSVLPNGTLQLTIDPTVDGDDGNYSCVATVRSTQEEHIRTAYLQFACKPIFAASYISHLLQQFLTQKSSRWKDIH